MTDPLPTAMFPSGLDLEGTKQLDGAYAQCHLRSAIDLCKPGASTRASTCVGSLLPPEKRLVFWLAVD